MDCRLPGSSVCLILQARIPEWVAISSSRGSSWPRNQTHVSCISSTAGGFFTTKPPGKSLWSGKVIRNDEAPKRGSLWEAIATRSWNKAGMSRVYQNQQELWCPRQLPDRRERQCCHTVAWQGRCQANKHFFLGLPPSSSLHCLNPTKGG